MEKVISTTVCSVLGGISAVAGSGALSLCSQNRCDACFGCVGAIASLGVILIAKKVLKRQHIDVQKGNLEV
ncbi:MAG: hypothetical protein H7844_10090 [Nitrospirae bacterium YQR-1]